MRLSLLGRLGLHKSELRMLAHFAEKRCVFSHQPRPAIRMYYLGDGVGGTVVTRMREIRGASDGFRLACRFWESARGQSVSQGVGTWDQLSSVGTDAQFSLGFHCGYLSEKFSSSMAMSAKLSSGGRSSSFPSLPTTTSGVPTVIEECEDSCASFSSSLDLGLPSTHLLKGGGRADPLTLPSCWMWNAAGLFSQQPALAKLKIQKVRRALCYDVAILESHEYGPGPDALHLKHHRAFSTR
eukprot:1726537-Amphidinium_carterae.1